MRMQISIAMTLAAGIALAAAQPLYENNFEKSSLGRLTEEFLVLDGAFAVREEGGNRFLELPGAPVDDFTVQFGPSEPAGLVVSARVFGTRTGRRFPVLAVGLNGAGGYELQLAPAKKAIELFKGDERLAAAQYAWEPGTWTWLRLQIVKIKDGEWRLQGKAWKEGASEPVEWLIAYTETNEPPAGRAFVSGHPFSGTPLRFDDLRVARAAAK